MSRAAPTFEEWWAQQPIAQDLEPPPLPAQSPSAQPLPITQTEAVPLSFEEWWAQQPIARDLEPPPPPAQPAPTAPAAATPTAKPEQSELEWDFNAAHALRQVPASAREFVNNTLAPILSPIDTATDLGKLIGGTVAKYAIPGRQSWESHPEAVGQYLSDRYGGWQNLKRTAEYDPVGVLADAAGVLTGGSSLVAKLPGIAGRAAATAGRGFSFVDPASNLVRAARGVAALGKTASQAAAKKIFQLEPGHRQHARALVAAGIHPTIGSTLGGGAQRLEDKLMSSPILGPKIERARGAALNEFNRAAYNRALAPLGETAADIPVGKTGIEAIHRKFQDQYADVKASAHFSVDETFQNELNGVLATAATLLPRKKFKQFETQFKHNILDKIYDDAGAPIELHGQTIKNLQTEFDELKKAFTRGTGFNLEIGRAYGRLSAAFDAALKRGDPETAAKLQQLDAGYANYVRLEEAGAMAGAGDGGFSPAQLRSAVKKFDTSVRKGATARGGALLQDLADPGKTVLESKVPNSGTAERLMAAAAASGAGAGAISNDVSNLAYLAAGLPPLLLYREPARVKLAQRLTGQLTEPGIVGQLLRASAQHPALTGQVLYQSGKLNQEIAPMYLRNPY